MTISFKRNKCAHIKIVPSLHVNKVSYILMYYCAHLRKVKVCLRKKKAYEFSFVLFKQITFIVFIVQLLKYRLNMIV